MIIAVRKAVETHPIAIQNLYEETYISAGLVLYWNSLLYELLDVCHSMCSEHSLRPSIRGALSYGY